MKDIYVRKWIIENALNIVRKYDKGVLTVRAIHYQLVGLGMPNEHNNYKRVVSAMGQARRDGVISYDTFSDHERSTVGRTNWRRTDVDTSIGEARSAIKSWMNLYYKNIWENQDVYLEVWIEKKTLQGTFAPPCSENKVMLCPCKGYPSLTYLHEASIRFKDARAEGKELVIIYFGDYDASGENIPEIIERNLSEDFGVSVTVDVGGLTEAQINKYNLPVAPTKNTDTRSNRWSGIGQVELDSVEPRTLQSWVDDKISNYFDEELREELEEMESIERVKYISELQEFVKEMEL